MIELVIRLTQLRSLRSATGYPFMYICAFQQGKRYHMARFSRWRKMPARCRPRGDSGSCGDASVQPKPEEEGRHTLNGCFMTDRISINNK